MAKKPKVEFVARDKRLEFQGLDAIDTDVLETFAYQYPGRDIEITTTTDEFTSVCPFSGLPDFGTVTITYIPDKVCVELRSLKYYLLSYRNVGVFYEHLANRMLEDLVRILSPKWIEVECEMTVRGGLQTTIRAQFVGQQSKRRGAK
ncbi:preQ(1) synthase [bacterium]|nr:preQ(1) synthase [bacterium]